MGGGAAAGGNVKGKYNAKFTWTSFLCCLAASFGGALFGYDNGVMGGVISQAGFLGRFFGPLCPPPINPNPAPGDYLRPSSTPLAFQSLGKEYCPQYADYTAATQTQSKSQALYCQFNSQILQLLTSVLFLAGTVSECTGFTAYLNRYHGRTRVMMYSGVAFMIAGILFATAYNVSQIFIGRILQGFAISFASVSVPIYNSEMAPPQFRGTFNQLFQLTLTFFILVAQVINLIMHVTKAENSWGFRLSLGFAFVPSFFLFLGGVFLPDSPNSLLERGFPSKARKNLEYVRGTPDVDKEFNDIVEAAELAAAVKHPWRNLFSAKYRPQLVLSACCTLFQQWTGINILIFYAPEIFLALGASRTISLVAGIAIGACNHLSTYVSALIADYVGRRFLFLEAGVQMFAALITISISLLCLGAKSIWEAWYILGLACFFDMAYAWSWGPLAWTYPSEIQVLETRSAGMAVTSLFNLLFSFVIGQTFLSMLCSLQWGVFLLFACCVAFMTTFVFFFFPETKGIPIEECPLLFKSHWFWKRYANRSIGFQERMVMEKKMMEAAEQGKPLPDIPGMESVKEEILNRNGGELRNAAAGGKPNVDQGAPKV